MTKPTDPIFFERKRLEAEVYRLNAVSNATTTGLKVVLDYLIAILKDKNSRGDDTSAEVNAINELNAVFNQSIKDFDKFHSTMAEIGYPNPNKKTDS